MKNRILFLILATLMAIALAIGLSACTVTPPATDPDLSGITLSDSQFTYTGEPFSLSVGGTLPEGVTVSYENNGKINVGVYQVTARFYNNGKYLSGKDLKANLTINKASYASAMENVSFDDAVVTFDGKAHSIEISGELPEGVSVTYVGNGVTSVGEYVVTARFYYDLNNYEPIEDMTAKLTIKKAEPTIPDDLDLSNVTLNGASVVYNGSAHSLSIEGSLPENVTVEYSGNGKTVPGEYTVTAKFYYSGSYVEGADLTATLFITKASIDMSGVTMEDNSVAYDGNPHTIQISGTLPSQVSGVEYVITQNGNAISEAKDAGLYKVTAKFKVDEALYNTPAELFATLVIAAAEEIPEDIDLSGVSFENSTVEYDGNAHTISPTGTLPENVSYQVTGGDKTAVGEYTLTLKFYWKGNYIEGEDKTATLTVSPGRELISGLALTPKTFIYDGTPKSIEVSGNLPEGVTVVEYIGNGETDAGTYQVTLKLAYNGEYLPALDMTSSYTISKKTVTYSVTNLTVSFNGSIHTIKPSSWTFDGWDELELVSSGNGRRFPGTYSVTFSIKVKEGRENNYTLKADTTVTLKINEDSSYATAGLEYQLTSVGYAVIGYTGTDKDVVIPSIHEGMAVVSISSLAFRDNSTVRFVHVPDSVTAIGQGAFKGTSLEAITLPFVGGSHVTSNKYVGYIFGASAYGANSSFVPATLKVVNLSKACKYIPAHSFVGCNNIESVIIGSGVTEIGISAFADCTAMKSIYIPKTVTDIPAAANYYNSPFDGCTELCVYLEASSVPSSGYGAHWNSVSETAKVTVVYGKTYSDYLKITNK